MPTRALPPIRPLGSQNGLPITSRGRLPSRPQWALPSRRDEMSANSLASVRSLAFQVCREHRIVLVLCLGYVILGGLTLTFLGRRWPLRLIAPTFHLVWLLLSASWLGWQYLRSPKRLRTALALPRLLGAILVITLVVPTQITFQALKQSIGPLVGFNTDAFLHKLDVGLHGQMPWLWLEWLLAYPGWIRFIDALYTAWFGILFIFVVWASWSGARELRLRSLVALLLLWIVAGTGVAGALASAGPCYYGEVVAGPNPYEDLLARLDAVGAEGNQLGARVNQQGLWTLHRADRWGPLAGISAMPSLHVAVAVLYALVAWGRSRTLAGVFVAYALAIQVGSVALAWHYATDGYLGAALAAGSWSAAGALVRRDLHADNPFGAS